jgi:hypothetical protein
VQREAEIRDSFMAVDEVAMEIHGKPLTNIGLPPIPRVRGEQLKPLASP